MSNFHYPMSKHKSKKKDPFLRQLLALVFIFLYAVYTDIEDEFLKMKKRIKKIK